MRKVLSALLALALVLCALPVRAEDDAVLAAARAQAQSALDDMRGDAEGWVALMLEHAEITDVSYGSKSVNVSVSVPTLASGVSSRTEAGDDPAGYLREALAPYLTYTPRAILTLNMTYAQKDGQIALKWSGVSNPRNFVSKLKSLAAAARKSYTLRQMRLALSRYLLPRAAEMPKRQPETMPTMTDLSAYAAQAAAALNLTAEQASLRLPCLLMLMELTGIDAAQSLEQAVLTVKVKDWQQMLEDATAAAKTRLDAMMGVPDMSRIDYERVLGGELPAACLTAFYPKKGAQEQTIAVDLPGAVSEGVQASGGLMNFFAAYDRQVEAAVDALALYGATLPYYPRVDLINTGVLSGAEDEDGRRVTFDMGSDTADHGFVRVVRDGKTVLTGFVRKGVRLTVRLAQGEYTVYYSAGPEWYGEDYLFGKEAAFGRFTLTVGDADRTVVHMSPGGDLPVTELTQEEFAKGT